MMASIGLTSKEKGRGVAGRARGPQLACGYGITTRKAWEQEISRLTGGISTRGR